MTRTTTNRAFDPSDQFAYLRSTLWIVVTAIFLITAGNATAMPLVMRGLDQNPETIVQKVACLSIGFFTSCQHGSGDNLFKTNKNKKHLRKRERQKDQRGSAQTDAATTSDTQPVYEKSQALSRPGISSSSDPRRSFGPSQFKRAAATALPSGAPASSWLLGRQMR